MKCISFIGIFILVNRDAYRFLYVVTLTVYSIARLFKRGTNGGGIGMEIIALIRLAVFRQKGRGTIENQ